MEKQNKVSIVESEPKKAKGEVVKGTRTISATSYMGPLPPPELFAQYEQILPGAADRILNMAERQSLHRQTKELIQVKTESRDSLLGIISAFLISVITIIAGVYVIKSGHAVSGTILGTTGLVSLVSVFIYGTRNKQIDEKTKPPKETE